jgi:glycine dehydrogenase subunit 1
VRYVSLTDEERREMLEVIGVEQTADLFHSIPESVRLKRELCIPSAVPEASLLEYFKSLGKKNASTESHSYFLGAGAYNHFIPTIIDSIISRKKSIK